MTAHKLPSVATTLFTLRVPRGIQPELIIGDNGFDPSTPYLAYYITVVLDWSLDAPRIMRARFYPPTAQPVKIPHENICLAISEAFNETDVFDEATSTLTCDVLLGPLDADAA